MEPGGCQGARRLRPLQFSRDPHAHLRRHAAVLPQRRRRDRHRVEGDVHVGGQGACAKRESTVADTSSGEHCRRGARLHRARPRQAKARCRSSITSVRSFGASVRRRADTVSSFRLAPRSSGRRARAANLPPRDAEVLEMLATLLDEVGLRDWQSAAQFRGLRRRSRALQQGAARGVEAGRAPDVLRLPAPGGDKPAARARLQGSRGPADHREAAEDQRIPRRRPAARTSKK